MRPRAVSPLVCAVAVLVASVAHAADQPISGDLLKIKSSGGRAQIVFKSKDAGFLFPGAADAPSTNGAVVEIIPATVGPVSMTLPAGVGKPGWSIKTTGIPYYKFGNSDAPDGISAVNSALIKEGKQITLVARQGFSGSGVMRAVAVRITVGTIRYCAFFDAGSVKRDRVQDFLAKKAPAPAIADCSDASLGVPNCNVGPAPTCGGHCAGDGVCTANGGTCRCVSPSDSCGGTFPTCNGVCPVGEECFAGATFTGCGCLPVGSTSCGGTTPPACGGSCIPGEACESASGQCGCFPNGICDCPPGHSCELHPPAFFCVPD